VSASSSDHAPPLRSDPQPHGSYAGGGTSLSPASDEPDEDAVLVPVDPVVGSGATSAWTTAGSRARATITRARTIARA